METQKQQSQAIKQPSNNTQEVLLTLIHFGKVSLFDFPYLAGFRTRISELKNKFELQLITVTKTQKNRWGNTYTYHEHILPDDERTKAINIYNNIS